MGEVKTLWEWLDYNYVPTEWTVVKETPKQWHVVKDVRKAAVNKETMGTATGGWAHTYNQAIDAAIECHRHKIRTYKRGIETQEDFIEKLEHNRSKSVALAPDGRRVEL